MMLQISQPVVATRSINSPVGRGEVRAGTIGRVQCRCETEAPHYDVLFYVYPGHRCLVEHLTESDIAAMTAIAADS
jgi:hypothetical protein